jgi:hypothetical protein
MIRYLRAIACGPFLIVAVLLANAQATVAQSAFHAGRISVAPRLPARPLAAAGKSHVVFGWIVRLMPHGFTLRLRSGRLIFVNSDIAVSTDHYSAPLFVNKIVVAQGQLDASGILHAQTIEKLPGLDPSTGADH